MLDADIEQRLTRLQSASVRVERAPPSHVWSLRARPTALAAMAEAWRVPLPDRPLTIAGDCDRQAFLLGPDEWMLFAADSCAADGLAALSATLPLSLVAISDREIGWRIHGPDARRLLATGCPLDLDEAAFPPDRATRTLFGQAEILLWRGGDASEWHVRALRSFADYLTRRWAAAIEQP